MCINDFQKATEMNYSNWTIFFLMLYIFIPSSFISDMSRLAYVSYFGMSCFIFIYLCVSYNAYTIISSDYSLMFNNKHVEINLKEIPKFFGVILFTYDINGVLGSIRGSMENSKQKFRKVLFYYIAILYFIALVLGIMCSSAYGEKTKQMVFFNLESQSASYFRLTKFIDILYAMSLFSGTMLYNYPCFTLIDKKANALLHIEKNV